MWGVAEASGLWVRWLTSDLLPTTSWADPFVPRFPHLEPGQSSAVLPQSCGQGHRVQVHRPRAPWHRSGLAVGTWSLALVQSLL